MATVTTPSGDTLEGVTGQLLDYYRGQGYQVTEDGEVPVVASPAPVVEPVVESVQPLPEPEAEPVAEPVEPAPQVA